MKHFFTATAVALIIIAFAFKSECKTNKKNSMSTHIGKSNHERAINSFYANMTGIIDVTAAPYNAIGNGINDDTTPIENAVTFIKQNGGILFFPAGKTFCISRAIRLSSDLGQQFIIKGDGATVKRIGLASSSDEPIFYFTTLSSPGSASKGSLNYNMGVYIYGLTFLGGQYGVGYKHAIAGQLKMYDCKFSGFEKGVVLSGTNGVDFYNCVFSSKYGLYCARVSEDSYTQNYTQEGFGWNDGVILHSCYIQCSHTGVYYSGSTSEGVLKLKDCLLLGTSTSQFGVWARVFTNLVIDGGFSEFFNNSSIIINAVADFNGFEPNILVVKNFQFTNGSSGQANRCIFSRAVQTRVEACHFNNPTVNPCIFFGSGVASQWDSPLTLNPTHIGGGGYISFNNSNIKTKEPILISHGINKYYLIYNQEYPTGSNQYSVYNYTRTYEKGYYTSSPEEKDFILTRNQSPSLSLSNPYTINSNSSSNASIKITDCITTSISKEQFFEYGNYGSVIINDIISR